MIENMRERDDITEQKVVSAQRASEIYFEKRVTGLCKPTLVQKVFFFFPPQNRSVKRVIHVLISYLTVIYKALIR